MLTIQNQKRAGKIFKCTIFVGYGGVIFFTGVAPSNPNPMWICRVKKRDTPARLNFIPKQIPFVME